MPSVELGRPLRAFVSYAREDEVSARELLKHLASLQWDGLISTWRDLDLFAGQASCTAFSTTPAIFHAAGQVDGEICVHTALPSEDSNIVHVDGSAPHAIDEEPKAEVGHAR